MGAWSCGYSTREYGLYEDVDGRLVCRDGVDVEYGACIRAGNRLGKGRLTGWAVRNKKLRDLGGCRASTMGDVGTVHADRRARTWWINASVAAWVGARGGAGWEC